jgi:hypothetical protein
MRHLIPAILCILPTVALSTTPECPDLNAVLAAVLPGGPRLDTARLINEAGAVAQDHSKLSELEVAVADHLPEASQEEVIDIVIAAYCRYIQTSSADVTASLRAFEDAVYQTISNPENVSSPRKTGWLYAR